MNSHLVFQREIPIKYTPDVLVVGGGPAGVAAATLAARSGCQVLLIEGQNCLGGMGTAGLVPAFMQFGDGENFLADGFGREVWESLRDAGGTGPTDRFSIRVEVLKRLYDQILLDAGVDFILQTQLVAVDTTSVAGGNKLVQSAIVAGKSGLFGIKADVYLDCTGDGDLCAWSGAQFELGDAQGNIMPGTLCSLWANIDWDRVKKPDDRLLEEAFQAGFFSVDDRHLPGMWQVGRTIGGGNIGHVFGVDATDERSLTLALVNARKSLMEYERYYRTYLDGFDRMELVVTAQLLGVRESRRIIGDYVLSLEDFKRQAIFEDEIGRYAYPIDVHASKPDLDSYRKFAKEYYSTFRYEKGESYGIPYRCLLPKGLDNVLVAGRCVSTDRYLQGSLRVMPGCYITGQAAGQAAALAVKGESCPRDISVARLQRALLDQGAFLPNFKKD